MSNKDIAKAAKKYAREIILEGTTALKNNSYDAEKKRAIKKLMEQFDLAAQKDPAFSLEFDENNEPFHRIKVCKELSFGNCYEQALLALDYVINEAPQVSAEIYCIRGGDHCFLVIGREKNSDPDRPETWGDQAYICDPWANAVYPASSYLSKLRNYVQTKNPLDGTVINNTEAFDSSRHQLTPIKNQNTDQLSKYNSDEHLRKLFNLFKEKYQTVLSTAEKLEKDLDKIARRLEHKHGKSNKKYEIISAKKDNLMALLEEMTTTVNIPYKKERYDEMKANLDKKLINAINVCDEAIKAIAEENSKYNKETSFGTSCLKFFKILPTAGRTQKANEQLVQVIFDLRTNAT